MHSFVGFAVTSERFGPDWPLTLSTRLCTKTLPPSGRFVIFLFLVVRRQEGDSGQVLVFRSDAPDDAQPMDLAVYPRAATLLDCNLDVSVILQGNKQHGLSCRGEEKNNILKVEPTDLSAVAEEQHSRVRGVDVDGLQLDQVVQRASAWISKMRHRMCLCIKLENNDYIKKTKQKKHVTHLTLRPVKACNCCPLGPPPSSACAPEHQGRAPDESSAVKRGSNKNLSLTTIMIITPAWH